MQANKKQVCAFKCREKMMEVNRFKCQKTRYWNVSDHEFDWQKVKINSSFSVKLSMITDPHWDADQALSSRLLLSAPSPAPPGSSFSPPGRHCCPGQGTETSCLNMQKNRWKKTQICLFRCTDHNHIFHNHMKKYTWTNISVAFCYSCKPDHLRLLSYFVCGAFVNLK